MTIRKVKLSPGPWHTDKGQIKDQEGNILAKYSLKTGDQKITNNAELMASAPNLLAAIVFTLQTFSGMTSEQFEHGDYKPVNKALLDAVKPFIRQTDGNGFEWWPDYSFFMFSMFGISDEKVREIITDDNEFIKYKEYCAREEEG